jgi:hypothetical protein
MAKKPKADKPPTTIAAAGYVTDGMYRWLADPARPAKSQTSPEEQVQRSKEIQDDLGQSWQDRIAEIREWLLEIAAPYWEGPLGDDYFWQDEEEGSGGWGEEINGSIKWRRITGNEIVIVGDQYYRILDPSNVPGYARAAVELFCTLDMLERNLESGTDLNSIVRDAIHLGQEIESIQDRAEFAPYVLSETGRRKGAQKAIEIVNEAHAELRPTYQAKVDQLLANGCTSYTAACVQVASSLGVSSRTVQKHTVNPAPRNRGKWQG